MCQVFFNNMAGVKMGSGCIICLNVFVCVGFLQYKSHCAGYPDTRRVCEEWGKANITSRLHSSARLPCPFCSRTLKR